MNPAVVKLLAVILFVVIGHIASRAKKSQDEARRRALMQRPQPRPATARSAAPSGRETAHGQELEPEGWEEVEDDDEPAKPVRAPAPAWTPPPAPRHVIPAATPLPESSSRKAIRLSPAGLRSAFILTEILGPPVALRD